MIDVGGQQFFACDECPIICQLDCRLAIAGGDPKSVDFQFDHCGCDKVGDEFFWCGYCEDAWADQPRQPKKGRRKTGRAYRRQMRVQKFNRQKNLALNCNAPALWVGIDKSGLPTHRQYQLWRFGFDDDNVQYTYIKRYKSSGRKKFYKDYSNRVARRSDAISPKGNQYRKLFDLWWTVY